MGELSLRHSIERDSHEPFNDEPEGDGVSSVQLAGIRFHLFRRLNHIVR